jgi:predicted nucleic acid-binding protein
MATYLLDTSVIIDVLNNKRGRGEILKRLLEEGHLLACCPVNVSEVYAGIRAGEEPRTAAFLESLDFLPLTREIARRAGLIKRDFGRRGATLSLADAMVAAVAIENGCVLITGNVKHFPSSDLRLFPL